MQLNAAKRRRSSIDFEYDWPRLGTFLATLEPVYTREEPTILYVNEARILCRFYKHSLLRHLVLIYPRGLAQGPGPGPSELCRMAPEPSQTCPMITRHNSQLTSGTGGLATYDLRSAPHWSGNPSGGCSIKLAYSCTREYANSVFHYYETEFVYSQVHELMHS